MKKYNIISIIMITITIYFVSKFSMVVGYDFLTLMYPFILSVAITMLYKKKSIKKCSSLYNVILLLIMLFGILFIAYIIYSIMNCMCSSVCSNNWNVYQQLLLLLVLFILLLFNIVDINKLQNIKTHIFTWIISTIVIMIYLRYYYDIGFIHNYMYQNQYQIQDSYIYITQNYIYFNILYISILIHYVMNKEK